MGRISTIWPLLLCAVLAVVTSTGCGFVPVRGHSLGAPRATQSSATQLNAAGGIGIPSGTGLEQPPLIAGGGLNVGIGTGEDFHIDLGADFTGSSALTVGDEEVLDLAFSGAWLMVHAGVRKTWGIDDKADASDLDQILMEIEQEEERRTEEVN